MLSDPRVQVVIVGVVANAAGAAIAIYLWRRLGERYLLFWGLAWLTGTVRFLVHFPADSIPLLRMAEVAVLFPLLFFFNALGSYDLMPTKPWRRSVVVTVTGGILLAYGLASSLTKLPIELAYVLATTVFLFDAICLWVAYRATRLSGHAIAAATFFCFSAWFAIGLPLFGAALAKSIIGPLFNIPLAISLVLIAFQRRGRELEESERTLQASLKELRLAQAELQFSWEQMRQLYVRLANVEDEERRALHAELHDQVGANLSALRLEIDVAATLLDRGDAEGARRELGGAREIAIETMAMARDLMSELRPPALDDYGLVAALRSLADAQSSRLHLAIRVEGADLAPRPIPVVEGALFRIAHEALANAARHARAHGVAIRVAERDGTIVVAIEDDGEGFDPAAPAAGLDHWGLKNMRERARAVGGILRIESAPGAGTRVVAEAPRGGA